VERHAAVVKRGVAWVRAQAAEASQHLAGASSPSQAGAPWYHRASGEWRWNEWPATR
jgi:hypothetical protein